MKNYHLNFVLFFYETLVRLKNTLNDNEVNSAARNELIFYVLSSFCGYKVIFLRSFC